MKKTVYNLQEQGGKKGFVNDNGEWLIQPLYEDIDVFREGVCWVKTGSKWGLINEKGETLIEPRYDDVREFNEGCGNVKLGGKWGVVDKAGNFVFFPQFDLIFHYDAGIAIVKSDGKYGFIDIISKRLIAPIYEDVQAFSEGFAGVKRNNLWGFIDEDGKYLIEPKFYVAESFNKGKALAVSEGTLYELDKQGNCREVREMTSEECDDIEYYDNSCTYFDGFIDESGNYVVKPKFERVDDFKDGYARVWIDGKEGIINTKGAYISEPQYVKYVEVEDDDCLDELLKTKDETGFENASDFKIINADDKMGVVDSNGNIVVEPKYSYVIWNAEEEVFTVQVDMRHVSRELEEELFWDHFNGGKKSEEVFDTRWGILDKNGKTIIEPQYNMHAHWDSLKFNEGLAAVEIGGKWGFIDKTGEVKIEPTYEIAYNFKNGFAIVRINDKWGIIDRKGDFVVQPQYLSIDNEVQDGYRIVQTESGKWTLMDEKFHLMFEPINYHINEVDGCKAFISGYSGFVDCKTGKIIEPKFHHVRHYHDGLAAVTVSEASMEKGDF